MVDFHHQITFQVIQIHFWTCVISSQAGKCWQWR